MISECVDELSVCGNSNTGFESHGTLFKMLDFNVCCCTIWGVLVALYVADFAVELLVDAFLGQSLVLCPLFVEMGLCGKPCVGLGGVLDRLLIGGIK